MEKVIEWGLWFSVAAFVPVIWLAWETEDLVNKFVPELRSEDVKDFKITTLRRVANDTLFVGFLLGYVGCCSVFLAFFWWDKREEPPVPLLLLVPGLALSMIFTISYLGRWLSSALMVLWSYFTSLAKRR